MQLEIEICEKTLENLDFETGSKNVHDGAHHTVVLSKLNQHFT